MPLGFLGRKGSRSRIDDYTLGYAHGWNQGYAHGYTAGRQAAMSESKDDLEKMAVALQGVTKGEGEQPATEPPNFLQHSDEETTARAHRLTRSG